MRVIPRTTLQVEGGALKATVKPPSASAMADRSRDDWKVACQYFENNPISSLQAAIEFLKGHWGSFRKAVCLYPDITAIHESDKLRFWATYWELCFPLQNKCKVKGLIQNTICDMGNGTCHEAETGVCYKAPAFAHCSRPSTCCSSVRRSACSG